MPLNSLFQEAALVQGDRNTVEQSVQEAALVQEDRNTTEQSVQEEPLVQEDTNSAEQPLPTPFGCTYCVLVFEPVTQSCCKKAAIKKPSISHPV